MSSCILAESLASPSAILPHRNLLTLAKAAARYGERKLLNIMIKGANKYGTGYILNWLELPFLYDRESSAVIFVPRNFVSFWLGAVSPAKHFPSTLRATTIFPSR